MKDSYSKLVMLLAALDLSSGELRQLLSEIKTTPVDDLLRSISEVSSVAKIRYEANYSLSNKNSQKAFREGSVGQRVERLMKDEANLSGKAAFNVLSDMLVKYGMIEKGRLPPLSKKALWIWIDKVVSLGVPEKEVLRLATIARNEIKHSPAPDWRLGNRAK